MQIQEHWRDAVAAACSTHWRDAALGKYMYDPNAGVLLDDPFTRYDSTDDWTLTQATTGTAAISTAAPGVLEIDSNSTTATQGVNLQRLVSPFVPVASSQLFFETKIKVVDTYDKAELFIGLAASDTTILATSANSSANHIGWQCVTDDGVLLFTSEKAGAGTTSAAATIEEATYVRLGFHVIGVSYVQQYINGVATGDPHETANIPIVAIYPSFVCQSGGTNDPILHVAGYRVFQTRV